MWIKSVNEDEATGVVAKIYKGTTRSWDEVDSLGVELEDFWQIEGASNI